MEHELIQSKFKDTYMDILSYDITDTPTDSNLCRLHSLDELDIEELIMGLEEAFDASFSDDGYEKAQSIDDFTQMIKDELAVQQTYGNFPPPNLR